MPAKDTAQMVEMSRMALAALWRIEPYFGLIFGVKRGTVEGHNTVSMDLRNTVNIASKMKKT